MTSISRPAAGSSHSARRPDAPLYLLPFDHRASYVKGMFHWTPPLDDAQLAAVSDSKQLIYEGFQAAVTSAGQPAASGAVPKGSAGILVDEAFGAAILRDAAKQGFVTAVSTEKSGSDEFDFEYGEDFGAHLAAFAPTYAKALVRYNIDGDDALNRRQTARLKQLSDYCVAQRLPFMFELLVPATDAQMAEVGGNKDKFDRDLRPVLMRRAIVALQDAGVEPAVWKIEGLDSREDAAGIVKTVRRDGRDDVTCIVLGRGANDDKVTDWLKIAASVPGFTGFAVGRTSFWEPVEAYEAKRMTREDAVAEICRRYQKWVQIFESARPASAAG